MSLSYSVTMSRVAVEFRLREYLATIVIDLIDDTVLVEIDFVGLVGSAQSKHHQATAHQHSGDEPERRTPLGSWPGRRVRIGRRLGLFPLVDDGARFGSARRVDAHLDRRAQRQFSARPRQELAVDSGNYSPGA